MREKGAIVEVPTISQRGPWHVGHRFGNPTTKTLTISDQVGTGGGRYATELTQFCMVISLHVEIHTLVGAVGGE